MEQINAYEKTRANRMDVDAYFNDIYCDTCKSLYQYIVIKTSNADQVDDIFQNVYKGFYIRITKKGFLDIRTPEAFLKKLAHKELSRHYKRKAEKREREVDLAGYDEAVPDESIPFVELMEQEDTLHKIQQLVKRLPLLSYKAFVLFYRYDMPVAHVAQQLGISEDNVKTRLFRARNAVRKNIKGELL